MSPRIGLVLEGGGMRAAYSAGALDCFVDRRVDIRCVVGVSAGANYVAGQRERNHALSVDFVRDRRYQGVSALVLERSWFGMNVAKLEALYRQRYDEAWAAWTS